MTIKKKVNGIPTCAEMTGRTGNSICLLLLTFLTFLTHPTQAASLTQHAPQKLPPLVFEDAAGAQHALSDYRGQYILLNIWATWCAPCVREMPSLDALQKNFGAKKLRVIPLSEDRGDDIVAVFYKAHAIANLPVAVDHAGIAPSIFKLNGLPTTLLIDPQGDEIARMEGDAEWASASIIEDLRKQMR